MTDEDLSELKRNYDDLVAKKQKLLKLRQTIEKYERKEKIITGCTDIHCTGFGGRCRITDAEIRKFCGNLYQAIWYDLFEFTEIHCRSDRTVFHYVWNYFHEGH